MKIKFIVWGDPKAKRRHRSRIARSKGGKQFNMQYPDPDGVKEESFIKLVAAEHRPEILIAGPVCLTIVYYLLIPKSTSKKKRQDMIDRKLYATKKPDLTNTTKAIEDACNKVIWIDDAQICEQHIYKFFGESPRSEVTIETLPRV